VDGLIVECANPVASEAQAKPQRLLKNMTGIDVVKPVTFNVTNGNPDDKSPIVGGAAILVGSLLSGKALGAASALEAGDAELMALAREVEAAAPP
jgi:hypothetical protein